MPQSAKSRRFPAVPGCGAVSATLMIEVLGRFFPQS